MLLSKTKKFVYNRLNTLFPLGTRWRKSLETGYFFLINTAYRVEGYININNIKGSARNLLNALFPPGTRRRKAIEPVYFFVLTKVSEREESIRKKHIRTLLEKEFLPFNFPKVENPDVSIVILAWNKFSYTYTCLKSILDKTDGITYEVVVVDNGSTDETVNIDKIIGNIRLVKNTGNKGFVTGCNMGAAAASGRYVLFLNNDTKVTEGWLGAMVGVMEKDAKAGMIGAKLIYADERLQEAGGIVWNDKANIAWNYGRFKEKDDCEYNYVKEVDFCSGACLLLRRDFFLDLGGFDELYSPAYCEDTDLAFRVRERGYKVIYQPKAEIMHFEGTTAGTDISRGFKKYQVVNQQKFYERWRLTLEKGHFKGGEDVFLARDRSKDKRVIVFIDHSVPNHDQDAASLATYQYLKLFLAMGFKVVFIPENNYKYEPYVSELQQMGIEVLYGKAYHLEHHLDWIARNGRYIHYVWLARPNVGIKYLGPLRENSKAKIMYCMVDLHYLRELRRYEIEKKKEILVEADKIKEVEMFLFENADAVLTYSEKEAAHVRGLFPGKEIVKIPIFFYDNLHEDGSSARAFEDRTDILFLGGFAHPPNHDAVEYFIKDIWPLIRSKLPDVNFYIIGSNPPESLTGLVQGHKGVFMVGYVKDITQYFQRARVFVAPLRYGAGVKGKIVTSISYGVPVVTTSIGNEGIDMTDGQQCLLADIPEEFASKTIELYNNKEIWEKLARNSIKFVNDNFARDTARKKIMGVL